MSNNLLILGMITILLTGCGTIDNGSSQDDGTNPNQYDGTYDWYLGSVHGVISHCSSCVYIKNGKITNSEGSFTNGLIDSFGNLVFNGPCPNGNFAKGTFTGKIGGHNPPQWQGTWTCADGSKGGTSSTWKIFNGH